jgi:hypothetical protein
MTEQKKSTSSNIGLAIRWVVAITGLILLIAKGLGAGISWLTILGVLAIPGALGVIGVAVSIPLLVIVGAIGVASNNSSK